MISRFPTISLCLFFLVSGVGFAQIPPTIQWEKNLGGGSTDWAYSIRHTNGGGYIVAGWTASNNADVGKNLGYRDVWVVKLDSGGNLVWEKTYGGSGSEEAYDIRQTSDGGYVVAGYTNSNDGDVSGGPDNGNRELWVLKLDGFGNLAWEATYGGSLNDEGYAIQQTTDGGYIVAGDTLSGDGDVGTTHGNGDAWVLKLNSIGALIWETTYGGSGQDGASDIQQTNNGGYIVGGNSISSDGDLSQNQGTQDAWIFKLSANGTITWSKSYGGSDTDLIGRGLTAHIGNDAVQQTSDGGYIAVGYTRSNDGDVAFNHGITDAWIFKFDSVGNLSWKKTYGGTNYDSGVAIQETLGGNFIVAAQKYAGNTDTDYWVFKIDPLGNLLWEQTYGGSGDDSLWSIQQVSGCEFILAGYSESSNGDVGGNKGMKDFWVVKLIMQWPPPDAPSPQDFCWRELPAIDSLAVQSTATTSLPVTFNWYDKKTDVVPLAGSTPLTDGEKYFVSQIIDGCESPMDSVVVNIVEDIIPDGPSPQSFCEDDNATIADFQITGQNLLWYQDPNNASELPPSTPLIDGGTYYVSQTIAGCESSRLGILAEVFPPPGAFPLSAVVACDTDGNGSGEFYLPDLDDDVSGGATGVTVTYHASLPDAKNGTAPLPDNYSTQTSPQSIYARVLDTATGCDSIVEVVLEVSPVPEIMGVNDLIGCDDGNGTANFDLTENNGAVLGSQDPDDLQITYHESQAEAENGQNAIPNPESYTSTDKTIFVRLENTGTGCFDADSFIISVKPRPDIANISIEKEFCSDLQGGDFATVDLTVYDDQINPGNPANTQVVYYESPNAYNAGQPIESPESYTTVSNPQILVAEVVDTGTGCPSAGFVEISIHVNDRPVVDLSQYDGRALCWDSDLSTPVIGGNYEPIVLETGLDESEYNFTWTLNGENLPETGPSLEATKPGVYEVAVTDTDGLSKNCSSTSKAEIVEANPPEFALSRTSKAVASEHGILVSELTGIGNFEFRLDDGEWVSLGQDDTVLFEGVAPGTHIVYGKSLEGCGTTAHGITLIGYPRFFTPNQDGFNDRWNITGLQKGEIYIFDRYGKLLQSLDPQRPGWDGMYNGHPMPSDDYWFKVEFTENLPDGSERKGEFAGNFSLLR